MVPLERTHEASRAAERQVRWGAELTIGLLAGFGELVPAAAIIATLVYLALQIRGSAAATRAEARRSMDSAAMETVRRIADNADLAQLLMLGLQKPEALTPEQAFRFSMYISQFFALHETVWEEVQLGTISNEELVEQSNRILGLCDTPG